MKVPQSKQTKRVRQKRAVSPVKFDDKEERISLLRAAQWTCLLGKAGTLTLEEVEKAAFSTLLPALARGDLAAKGLRTRTGKYEKIPRGRWALVTMSPLKAGQFLQWINQWLLTESEANAEHLGGELTRQEDRSSKSFDPYVSKPTWADISVATADLRRVFLGERVSDAVVASKNRNAGGALKKLMGVAIADATSWLMEIMRQSPDWPSKTQNDLVLIACDKFPPLSQRMFKREVWKAASTKYPRWSSGLRPSLRPKDL